MLKCSQCAEQLPPENDFVSCGGCGNNYHYGCANVREKAWRKFSLEVKLSWKCVICKTKALPADSGDHERDEEATSLISRSKPSGNITLDDVVNTVTMTTGSEASKDNAFDEVGYLRELLKHKDTIIERQADLIESLKEQLRLLKLGPSQLLGFQSGKKSVNKTTSERSLKSITTNLQQNKVTDNTETVAS